MDTPETISKQTVETIAAKGYCFWRCEALNNEVIIIIKGIFNKDRAIDAANKMIENGKLKEIPVVYTIEELHILCDSAAFKLVHEAKKIGGAIEEEENNT